MAYILSTKEIQLRLFILFDVWLFLEIGKPSNC
jgi:hypothetical protein